MTTAQLGVLAAIASIALGGYFFFPGHTFLQSDTQIYIPVLERLWNPSLYQNELIVSGAHVSLTIYDEVALLLRRIPAVLGGASFERVLTAQQLLFRALGLLGIYFMGRAMKLGRVHSVLVAAACSLGATIIGPAVLTIEYEPVPRGFAIGLIVFALGCVAREWWALAGTAASLAFLYHAPAIWPFWMIVPLLLLAPNSFRERAWLYRTLGIAIVVLGVLAWMQAGIREEQQVFRLLEPEHAKLQLTRASYNWISVWFGRFIGYYLFAAVVLGAAYWRLRHDIPPVLKPFLIGMPAAGLLSVPVSYLLLEKLGWSLVPQVQPMRALLYVVEFALILAAVAGVKAAARNRWPEAFAWFVFVYSVPVSWRTVLTLTEWEVAQKPLTILLCAAVAFVACRFRPAVIVAVAMPMFLIPNWAKVKNYAQAERPALTQLYTWARNSTPVEKVFLFPDAARSLEPGVFRARALRAVYVDWKGGGQVNYFPRYAREWWRRWQAAMEPKFTADRVPELAALGIDYLVLKHGHELEGREPLFDNADYTVYSIR